MTNEEFENAVMHPDNWVDLLDDVNAYTRKAQWGGPDRWTENQQDFFIDAGVRYVYGILAKHNAELER